MTGRFLHRDQQHQNSQLQDGAAANLWQATHPETLTVQSQNVWQQLFIFSISVSEKKMSSAFYRESYFSMENLCPKHFLKSVLVEYVTLCWRPSCGRLFFASELLASKASVVVTFSLPSFRILTRCRTILKYYVPIMGISTPRIWFNSLQSSLREVAMG